MKPGPEGEVASLAVSKYHKAGTQLAQPRLAKMKGAEKSGILACLPLSFWALQEWLVPCPQNTDPEN